MPSPVSDFLISIPFPKEDFFFLASAVAAGFADLGVLALVVFALAESESAVEGLAGFSLGGRLTLAFLAFGGAASTGELWSTNTTGLSLSLLDLLNE